MKFLATLEREAAPVRDTVRSCLENGTPLRITARRGWLDAGRVVQASDQLAASESGIIEYVPGDLTITVRSGTPLSDIARATEANNQWLPLDPFGAADGSIGATVATASAGALAHAFGTPRDQVIGLGFVTGKGDYVRSGGRVVKNVAGFDLTRLLIGSWGTLGVITDVTLRLRARPEADVTVALVLSEDVVHFRRTLAEIAAAPLAPNAMELVNGAVARAIGLDGDSTLLVRLGGNSTAVAAQRDVLRRLGEVRELGIEVWDRLRAIEPAGASVVRLSGPLSEFVNLWKRVERELEGTDALVHGTPGRGQVRCIVPASAADLLTAIAADDPGVHRTYERLTVTAWTRADALPNARLAQRVREAFDPASLLNPGILA